MNGKIAYPTLNRIKSALFIQPHPDDNEVGAGGTIALLRGNGVKVYGLTVTLGEGGSTDPAVTPDEIAEVRKAEADRAMGILGVQNLGNLGYPELRTIPHDQLVTDLVSVLRHTRVDAVFTVDPGLKDELHPTHIQVGNAVSEAFMRCGIPGFPAGSNVHEDAFPLKMIGYYMTDSATTVVNISDVMELKMKALAAHESQMSEALLGGIYSLAEANALGFPFAYAEPLRLLGPMHTHCFSIPSAVRKLEAVSLYP